MDVGETVDPVSAQVGNRRHQVFAFRFVRQFERQGSRRHMAANERVVNQGLWVQQLPFQINFDFSLSQTVDVLLRGFHEHPSSK